jgi:hypothetical protein
MNCIIIDDEEMARAIMAQFISKNIDNLLRMNFQMLCDESI